VPITALAVVAALVLTGSVSAHLGGSSKRRAVLRTVAGGMAAMAVTYSIGLAVGTQI
jgi:VIT1/CCC1 family predicted Fe2+/Mn2+ transporter